ncbi:hypothetical protein RB195_010478 [Necator americanus]|uniref:Uncharacterized protein n=1 Tax=Necator americanus TaxID=51031 RepID=A0ABR1D1F8_NECAM
METGETPTDFLDWKRQNNLARCQRIVAYVLRLIKMLLRRVNANLREKVESTITELRSIEMLPYITAREREIALRVIVHNHQKVHLPPERQITLKQLKLKEDENGILRCRGRLGNPCLPPDAKYPCLIASKSDLARLTVEQAHGPLYCGTGHTMAIVRERF